MSVAGLLEFDAVKMLLVIDTAKHPEDASTPERVVRRVRNAMVEVGYALVDDPLWASIVADAYKKMEGDARGVEKIARGGYADGVTYGRQK